MTANTPTRRRLDGERVAHMASTVELPGYGPAWVTECHSIHAKGAMRSAEGCPLCPACATAWKRAASYADAVSVVEQPETPPDLERP